MLSYAVVAEYYCPADSTPYLGFLSESLESDTNGLQAFIGKSLTILVNFIKYLVWLKSIWRGWYEGEIAEIFPFFSSENNLLMGTDLGKSIRTIPDGTLLSGYRLVSKIENTREKLLVGYHHRFKLGDLPDDLGLRAKVGQQADAERYRSVHSS